ncbi:hypothetical protein Trydic_g15564 [Trypoxylus dichotomus]
MRRKFANEEKEIVKPRNENGNIASNREQLPHIMETFYETKSFLTWRSTFKGRCKTRNLRMSLKKMQNYGVSSDDDVIIEAIKIGGPVLMAKIQELYNLYLEAQNIPTKWKKSITILIHKKGDTADLENYRLITLLNHL